MFNQKEMKIILICFLFLLSCAGPGLEISKKEVPLNIASNNESKVIWEPKPRPVAKGNDGQLLVRTSESMKLLYAAHNNKGKQNLFMAKTKNIGDSFSNSISVNSEKDEVSAHGETGPKLKQGKGRGIFTT